MRRLPFGTLLLSAALLVPASPVDARGRDSDGNRMMAVSIQVGSRVRDSLSPPRDRVDWRMLKIAKSRRVSLSLTNQPVEASVRLKMEASSGKSVASLSTRKGSGSTSVTLSPGLYYIQVSSSSRVSYTLSVQ